MLTFPLAASLIVFIQAIQAPQPPAAPAPLRGTAIVRGQVTDRETGLPTPRAAVTLRLNAGNLSPVFQNLADADGRFEFTHLPAGSYHASARAGEYRATHVREMHDPLPSGGARALTLKDGEVRSDVNFTLRRSLGITGRVVDEFGEPVANVRLRVTSSGPDGRSFFGMGRTTDDRGQFRVFGLPPGPYVICAEVDRAANYLNAVSTRVDRFVTTCHPSAAAEKDAQAVVLAGNDADGVEIRMRRSRTFTISGSVVDANGAPAEMAMVSFHRIERGGRGSSTSASPDGRFRFTNLVPGEYAVEASVGLASYDRPDRRPPERGYVPLKLDADDITDVVVMMKKPATVQGRVTFQDAPPASRDTAAMTIAPMRENQSFSTLHRPARLDDDLSFTLTDIFDPLQLTVQGLPHGWAVKSMRYKGEDITERPAEFVTDPRHRIEILLTSRLAVVSGAVTDDTGKPATGAIVLLVHADAAAASSPAWRATKTPTLKTGTFEMPGVRAGEYLIVAVPRDYYQSLIQDRLPLQPLLKQAEPITLVENDRMKLNLRLVTPDAR